MKHKCRNCGKYDKPLVIKMTALLCPHCRSVQFSSGSEEWLRAIRETTEEIHINLADIPGNYCADFSEDIAQRVNLQIPRLHSVDFSDLELDISDRWIYE